MPIKSRKKWEHGGDKLGGGEEGSLCPVLPGPLTPTHLSLFQPGEMRDFWCFFFSLSLSTSSFVGTDKWGAAIICWALGQP